MHYSGIVQKGSAKATTLGFPTVNIPLSDTTVSGIYAAMVNVGEEEYEAVAYADTRNKKLEAHLFGLNDDLYGRNIGITLLKKLRDDRTFRDEQEAKAHIADDVEKARAYFKNP